MEPDNAQIRLQCAQDLALVTGWRLAEAAAACEALSTAIAQCGTSALTLYEVNHAAVADLERRMRTPLTGTPHYTEFAAFKRAQRRKLK